MVTVREGIEGWVTVRWHCDCGRWVLWKATPQALLRHGLDVLKLARGQITSQLGQPPVSAFDVLHHPTFNCSCGRRVPVAETLADLLRFSRGVILWEGKAGGPVGRPVAPRRALA